LLEGFFKQVNDQLGKHIFNHPLVRQRFPGMTDRPTLGITPIEKSIPLNELSQFASQLYPIMPFGDDDIIAIRRKSEFLPETLPKADDVQPTPETAVSPEPTEPEPDMTPEEAENADGEMSVSAWWKLRQEIYANRNLPHDLLIDMLDHAETSEDLARIEYGITFDTGQGIDEIIKVNPDMTKEDALAVIVLGRISEKLEEITNYGETAVYSE